jgi:5-methylcytosine-specific restriction endonuclease McrBC GTP-binding regulatory subunit McrB
VELPLNLPGGQYKSMIIYEVSEDHLKYKRRTLRNTVREEERLLSLHKLKDKFEGREIREAINKVYYEAVTDALRQFSNSLRLTRDGGQLRNYVLVIDEVNRANVSRVFGELITLLEEDKRLGTTNALAATLPSGESFGVPPNLYVVGTMNTADKSVSLLDVALRRRFAFVPLYPDYSLVPDFEPVLRPLNEKIREKKGTDFLVGHSYFIGKDRSDLPGIFNRKIIPLLYEYFQNRPEPVREVLEATGLNITEENFQWKAV